MKCCLLLADTFHSKLKAIFPYPFCLFPSPVQILLQGAVSCNSVSQNAGVQRHLFPCQICRPDFAGLPNADRKWNAIG